jgi:hypothetical protein
MVMYYDCGGKFSAKGFLTNTPHAAQVPVPRAGKTQMGGHTEIINYGHYFGNILLQKASEGAKELSYQISSNGRFTQAAGTHSYLSAEVVVINTSISTTDLSAFCCLCS